MIIRQAISQDIAQLQVIRHAVQENRLSDPGLVTDGDCLNFLEYRGRGWVCEVDREVVGFAIADLVAHQVWALFVHPDFQGLGIGRKLHDTLLDWYFDQTDHKIWLSTAPQTKAEIFYRKAGWKETGWYGNKELKFEMHHQDWRVRPQGKPISG